MHQTLLLLLGICSTASNAQQGSTIKPLQAEKRNDIVTEKQVRISCYSKVPDSTETLFVIDGVASTKDDVAKLNSHDIESISVLKGTGERMLGCRPAGSVIVVRLKKLKNVRLKIIDEKDSIAITNGTVQLITGGKTTSFAANDKGEVALPEVSRTQVASIAISSVGYLAKKSQISFDSSGQTVFVAMQRHVSKMPEVIITRPSYCIIRCRFPGQLINQYFVQKKKDSLQGNSQDFLVYPNPATSNAKVTILPKKSISGHYRVLNLAGQILHTGILNHSPEQPIIIPTANWSAGAYFIQLLDIVAAKAYTKKFIVQ